MFVDTPETSGWWRGATSPWCSFYIAVSSPLPCDVPGPRPSVGSCSGPGRFTSGSRPLSRERQLIRECGRQTRIIKLAVPAVSWGPGTRARANMVADCGTCSQPLIISGMKQGEELSGLEGKLKRLWTEVWAGYCPNIRSLRGLVTQRRASRHVHHQIFSASPFICFPPP